MAIKPFQLTKNFVAEKCDFCGRCFSECPVLHWPLEKAQKEIRALVEKGTSPAVSQCVGCMACNTICPHGANPHTLIVNKWTERYAKKGLPRKAGLVLPYQRDGLFETARRALPKDERALAQRWEENWRNPPDTRTMIYAGCNMMIQPFLLDSPLFKEIPIFGSLELCCGEPFYRMGCWDAARTAAKNVRNEFKRMRLEKIVVPCLACYHLFTQVYPKVLDTPLKVKVVTVEDWLCQRIASGTIAVRPLNKTVAIQDNCWPKASGDMLFDRVRALLGLLGVTVVEPPQTRENALCCGMCAGAARFSARDTLGAANRLLEMLEACPAEWVVDYCGGCNWLLSLSNQIFLGKYKKPRYHILELVQMAAGEKPKRRTDARMKQVITRLAPALAGRYLRGGRFWLTNVAGIPIKTKR